MIPAGEQAAITLTFTPREVGEYTIPIRVISANSAEDDPPEGHRDAANSQIACCPRFSSFCSLLSSRSSQRASSACCVNALRSSSGWANCGPHGSPTRPPNPAGDLAARDIASGRGPEQTGSGCSAPARSMRASPPRRRCSQSSVGYGSFVAGFKPSRRKWYGSAPLATGRAGRQRWARRRFPIRIPRI